MGEEKEDSKHQTTIVFSNQDISRKIGGQARLEGFDSMGEFIEFLFERFMKEKKGE